MANSTNERLRIKDTVEVDDTKKNNFMQKGVKTAEEKLIRRLA